MDPRHAVLITVDEESSEGLAGRTLLQKKIYFAGLLTGQNHGFRPHYYGPYSQVVADATDSLLSNRFLEEQIHIFPDTNVFGEIRRHSYKVTSDGAQLLRSIETSQEVEAWRSALRKINEHRFARDFNMLSIAAKVTAITGRAAHISAEEIKRRARSYGWSLSSDQIGQVAQFLAYLGL